jgi:hypothetical protein
MHLTWDFGVKKENFPVRDMIQVIKREMTSVGSYAGRGTMSRANKARATFDGRMGKDYVAVYGRFLGIPEFPTPSDIWGGQLDRYPVAYAGEIYGVYPHGRRYLDFCHDIGTSPHNLHFGPNFTSHSAWISPNVQISRPDIVPQYDSVQLFGNFIYGKNSYDKSLIISSERHWGWCQEASAKIIELHSEIENLSQNKLSKALNNSNFQPYAGKGWSYSKVENLLNLLSNNGLLDSDLVARNQLELCGRLTVEEYLARL